MRSSSAVIDQRTLIAPRLGVSGGGAGAERRSCDGRGIQQRVGRRSHLARGFGLAVAPLLCARALTAWRSRRSCGAIRSADDLLSSGAGSGNNRHSAYRFRSAMIAYRWHPLFGKTLQVSPFRRGKDLTCFYTNERPDLCRELPNWMFDESYCAGMALGRPEISIEGLNELASVLASFAANRKEGAHSSPSIKKETDRAEKPASQSSAAHSRAGTSNSRNTRGAKHKEAGRGPGRSSAGGFGWRYEGGRRG